MSDASRNRILILALVVVPALSVGILAITTDPTGPEQAGPRAAGEKPGVTVSADPTPVTAAIASARAAIGAEQFEVSIGDIIEALRADHSDTLFSDVVAFLKERALVAEPTVQAQQRSLVSVVALGHVGRIRPESHGHEVEAALIEIARDQNGRKFGAHVRGEALVGLAHLGSRPGMQIALTEAQSESVYLKRTAARALTIYSTNDKNQDLGARARRGLASVRARARARTGLF